MTLSEKQQLFTRNIAKLINHVYEQGYSCTFGEVFRTHEQAVLYASQGKGIVDSLHCKRLAVDINIFDKQGVLFSSADQYKPFGEYWESLHPMNRNGLCFKRVDADHFEMQDL